MGVGTAATAGMLGRRGYVGNSARRPDHGRIERPKSIIFMVSDGMSAGVPSLAEPFSQLVRSTGTYYWGLLRSESVARGFLDMASANSLVTDSAAAVSSWSTGERINNGKINVSPDGRKLTPIGRLVHQTGKRVGLVTTTRITHATPAGFVANATDRNREFDISPQYLEEEVDVLLGGGRRQFDGALRPDGVGLISSFREKGYSILDSRDSLIRGGNASGERMLGLFGLDHLPFSIDRNANEELKKSVPTLAEMTRAALASLVQHSGGFLLQVEGGRIDHAAHSNDAGALLWDQLAFDDAIGVVLEFLKDQPDTLVVVTTDHGNANPGLNGVGAWYAESTQAFERLADAKASYGRLRSEILRKRATAGAERKATTSVVHEVFARRLGIDLEDGEVAIISRMMDGEFPDEPSHQQRNIVGIVGQILGNYTGIGWTGVSHTADLVMTVAAGAGRSRFAGLQRNTDVFKHLAELLGVRSAVTGAAHS